MSKQLLFVYGTLLDESTRQTVIGKEVAGKPDVLQDFIEQATEVDNEPYPCAIASKGSAVQGLTLELSNEELQKVDDYETGAYDRQRVELASGLVAWVYALPTAVSSNT